RPERRVELDVVLHLAALSQPGGIDEHERAPLVVERRVDRVPRGARLVRHDQALLAEQAVHQARFAHVRPAYDRHVDITPIDPGLDPVVSTPSYPALASGVSN